MMKTLEYIVMSLSQHMPPTPVTTCMTFPTTIPNPTVPGVSFATAVSGALDTPENVVASHPKLQGDSKMGALAVALAKYSLFGEEMMRKGSVGGKGPGTIPLPQQGMRDIKKNYIVFVSWLPK